MTHSTETGIITVTLCKHAKLHVTVWWHIKSNINMYCYIFYLYIFNFLQLNYVIVIQPLFNFAVLSHLFLW